MRRAATGAGAPPTTAMRPRQGPLRDRSGTLDSDLLLKWGGGGVALLLLLYRGLAPSLGISAESLPGMDVIGVCLGASGLYGAKYLVKRGQDRRVEREVAMQEARAQVDVVRARTDFSRCRECPRGAAGSASSGILFPDEVATSADVQPLERPLEGI